MPQMSPYNWINMFIMFNMIIMSYSSYNNFMKTPSMSKKKYINKIKFNWKW